MLQSKSRFRAASPVRMICSGSDQMIVTIFQTAIIDPNVFMMRTSKKKQFVQFVLIRLGSDTPELLREEKSAPKSQSCLITTGTTSGLPPAQQKTFKGHKSKTAAA